MRDLFYLSETQLNRIKPYFPLSMEFPVLTICGDQRGHLRDPQWSAMEGCPAGIRTAQDLYNRMSDYKGARMLLPSLPKARTLIADRGYGAAWFRAALGARGITACIPTKRNRKIQIEYDKTLYRQKAQIENMFGRLKGWRRIAMRYDRCAIPSSPPSALPQPSSSISINEP